MIGQLDTVQYAVWKPAANPHHRTLFLITSSAGYKEVSQVQENYPDEVEFVSRSTYRSLLRKAYYRTNVRKTYLILSDNLDDPALGKSWRDESVFKMNHKYSYVFYEPKTGNRLRFWTQHCSR